MIIGFDLDGVIAHTIPIILPHLQKVNPAIKTYHDIHNYCLKELGKDQLREILSQCEYTGEFSRLETIQGAREGMKELYYGEDYDLIILTARDYYSSIHEETERWLHKKGIKFDELVCDRNKLDYINKRGIELMVEDNPIEIAHLNAHGIPCICFAQPWNWEVQNGNLVQRVENWQELVEHVKTAY